MIRTIRCLFVVVILSIAGRAQAAGVVDHGPFARMTEARLLKAIYPGYDARSGRTGAPRRQTATFVSARPWPQSDSDSIVALVGIGWPDQECMACESPVDVVLFRAQGSTPMIVARGRLPAPAVRVSSSLDSTIYQSARGEPMVGVLFEGGNQGVVNMALALVELNGSQFKPLGLIEVATDAKGMGLDEDPFTHTGTLEQLPPRGNSPIFRLTRRYSNGNEEKAYFIRKGQSFSEATRKERGRLPVEGAPLATGQYEVSGE